MLCIALEELEATGDRVAAFAVIADIMAGEWAEEGEDSARMFDTIEKWKRQMRGEVRNATHEER